MFRPCHEADVLFAQVLKKAEANGVQVLSYDVLWQQGKAFLGRRLPVEYGASVTGEVDAERLAEVLDFNANDPRKNWKSKKAKG